MFDTHQRSTVRRGRTLPGLDRAPTERCRTSRDDSWPYAVACSSLRPINGITWQHWQGHRLQMLPLIGGFSDQDRSYAYSWSSPKRLLAPAAITRSRSTKNVQQSLLPSRD